MEIFKTRESSESSEMDVSNILEDAEASDMDVSTILEDAHAIAMSLLPTKSAEKYLLEYDNFCKWRAVKQIQENGSSEAVLLVYFNELQRKYKPNTLWVKYSMLRTTIQRNENIEINYPKLISFLKKYSAGYRPKKSNVFEPHEISRFLSEADDREYLCAKVIMIFGIYGATRADELTKLTMNDVCEKGDIFLITILETKTKVVRSFTVQHEYAEYIRKYKKLRQLATPHQRFFVNFQKGKCSTQAIGRNKFLDTPKQIAAFLGLQDAKNFTGHSFRRTSATLLADGGADVLMLKRHGGWRSSSVAEGYVENSITNKMKIGDTISAEIKKRSTATSTIVSSEHASTDAGTSSEVTQSIVSVTQTSVAISSEKKPQSSLQRLQALQNDRSMEFNNCTFHFH